MTDYQYQWALRCWFNALRTYLDNREFYQDKSFLQLAKRNAKECNVPVDHLEKVSEWFDWDQVCKDIRP